MCVEVPEDKKENWFILFMNDIIISPKLDNHCFVVSHTFILLCSRNNPMASELQSVVCIHFCQSKSCFSAIALLLYSVH